MKSLDSCDLFIIRKWLYSLVFTKTRIMVIAFSNFKGGVGKSTIASGLADCLAKKGKKMLMVDMDAQCNLSSFYIDVEKNNESVYDALVTKAGLPIMNVRENIDLVPATLDLTEAERSMMGTMGREYKLMEKLDTVKKNYDYVFIDCSPYFGVATCNAFFASDAIVIPVTPSRLATNGMNKTIEAALEVESIRRRKFAFVKAVANFCKTGQNLTSDLLTHMQESMKKSDYYLSYIRESTSVQMASMDGRLPKRSNGEKDFQALTEEFLLSEKFPKRGKR